MTYELAGISLEHPVMNAAGTCKRLDDAAELARSATAAVMIGSITMEPRDGNSGDVYHATRFFSLNSLGLPNPGAEHYREFLPQIAELAHKREKPLVVSVAGFSPQENALLTQLALESGADIVEVNLGCPNVWDRGEQKRIASFDPNLIRETLRTIGSLVGENAPIGVKLSPFSDPLQLRGVTRAIEEYPLVKFVTSVNTFPNAFAFGEDGRPSITPGGGLAGMAGLALQPIGLGQIRQLRSLLPERIQLVGVGGIATGSDVLDYLRCGAAVVQVATAYLDRGEQVFSDILMGFVDAQG